jgi:hypothetical protein
MRRTPTAILACAGLTVALAAPGAAHAVPNGSPVIYPDNPTCADINPAWTETKQDNGKGGPFGGNGLTGTVTVDGTSLDWTASAGVDAVIVKGGPNANVYVYDPEALSGSGLTPPMNGDEDKPYGISHVSFCHDADQPPPPDDKDGPNPEPDPEPTPPEDKDGPNPEPKPDPKPEPKPEVKPDPLPEPQVQAPPAVTPLAAPAPVRVTAASVAAPVRRVASSAVLSGPRSCVSRGFTAKVSGQGIQSVTFTVNGRKVKTLTARGAQRTFALRVTPKQRVQRIRAQVKFVAGARRSVRVLDTTAIRCLQRVARPQFTG